MAWYPLLVIPKFIEPKICISESRRRPNWQILGSHYSSASMIKLIIMTIMSFKVFMTTAMDGWFKFWIMGLRQCTSPNYHEISLSWWLAIFSSLSAHRLPCQERQLGSQCDWCINMVVISLGHMLKLDAWGRSSAFRLWFNRPLRQFPSMQILHWPA